MLDEHMFLGHDPILNKDKNKKNIFKMIQSLMGCLSSLMDLKSNSEAGKLTKMVQEQHPFFKQ